MIRRDQESAEARKADLIRRKETLWAGMQLHGERGADGLRSDRWLALAELYDRCDDEIGELDNVIRFWEENELMPASACHE